MLILVNELDKAMRIYRTHQLFGKDGITGLGRTKFFEALKSGDFPAPNVNYRDNPKDSASVKPIHGWTSDLIEKWIESKRTDKTIT